MIPVGVIVLALLWSGSATGPDPAATGPLVPLRELRSDGTYVNWLEGTVGARGKTRVYRNIKKNRVFYEQARKKAELDGQDKILESLRLVRIDGATRLSDRQDLLESVTDKLRGVTSDKYQGGPGPVFLAEVVFPLFGVNGVSGAVLPGYEAARRVPEAPVPASEERGEAEAPRVTGLVVDASHLPDEERPVPVLLTRIVDTAGRIVHGPETADPFIARDNGLAAYAVELPGAQTDPAAQLRMGSNPLRIEAVGGAGPGNSDVVISPEDADRVLAAAASSPFLEGCQVLIVLVPPPPPEWPDVPPRDSLPPKTPVQPDRVKIPD